MGLPINKDKYLTCVDPKYPPGGPDIFIAVINVFHRGPYGPLSICDRTRWAQLLLEGCPYLRKHIVTCDFPAGRGERSGPLSPSLYPPMPEKYPQVITYLSVLQMRPQRSLGRLNDSTRKFFFFSKFKIITNHTLRKVQFSYEEAPPLEKKLYVNNKCAL